MVARMPGIGEVDDKRVSWSYLRTRRPTKPNGKAAILPLIISKESPPRLPKRMKPAVFMSWNFYQLAEAFCTAGGAIPASNSCACSTQCSR